MNITSDPKITPIVVSYEETIRQNRENGFNKVLLGQPSDLPSPFRPDKVRRSIERFSLRFDQEEEEEKADKLEFRTLRCRPMLMDAMMAPMLQDNETACTTPKKKKKNGSAFICSYPEVQKSNTNGDDDIAALRARVASLKESLAGVEKDRIYKVKAIEENKTKEIEKIRESCDQIEIIDYCDLMRQVQKNHKMVDSLRESNRILRESNSDLAFAIEDAKEQSIVLEEESSCMLHYYHMLEERHETERIVYGKVTDVLPKYRSKVSEFSIVAEERDDWIQMEKNIKQKYSQCLDRIVSALESKCEDADLLEQILIMSLGLQTGLKETSS